MKTPKTNVLQRCKQLETFYQRIRSLTANHDVIYDYACVTACKLGKALEEVDPEWWKNVPPMSEADKVNSVNLMDDNET